MILGIWVIALLSTIPWALFFELVPIFPEAPDVMLCLEIWPPGLDGALYFLLANLIACYLLPMVLITLCYVLIWIKVWKRSIPGDSKDAQMDRMQQKSKIKVVKMLIAVVILFVLSWLPLYIIFARIKFGNSVASLTIIEFVLIASIWLFIGKVIEPKEEEFLQIATPIAQWLGSSNSCINPILYAFFNKKYRRGFVAIIKSRSCCGRLRFVEWVIKCLSKVNVDLRYRYYENVAIASSSTSTRKSSHYHNKKAPYSPSIKSDAVSFIYDQNSNKKHNIIAKQDSNLSRQMLLKQDSNISRQSLLKQDSSGSRQMLIKQGSCDSVQRQDSNVSRQLLLKQDSNGSKYVLSKQDSQISYIESKKGQLIRQDSDLSKREMLMKQDSTISYIEPRKGTLCKQDTQISYIESKKNSLCSQDSVVSFIEHKRHQLVKQDSIVSFAEQKPGNLHPSKFCSAYKLDSHESIVVRTTKRTHSRLQPAI